MGWDEMEWVREVIDRWLTDNAMGLGLALALAFAVASFLLSN